MIILGIESTCDETGVAIVEWDPSQDSGLKVLANVIASSVELQKKYAGVVPEVAAREQVRVIIPVVNEALTRAFGSIRSNNSYKFGCQIDAIAVAHGPGLVGSLLIGVETAKALALVWNKPLIPINHLMGHVYANWLQPVGSIESVAGSKNKKTKNYKLRTPDFPLVALVVSGGHTDLILMTDHNKYRWLGGTLDDAAGEAFDKVARILGLGYPGGPEIERAAQQLTTDNGPALPAGRQLTFKLPRPLINSTSFDFSFSGLKTAVVHYSSQMSDTRLASLAKRVKGPGAVKTLAGRQVSAIAHEFQQAVCDILVTKTLRAAKKYQVESIVVGGGVAANQRLRSLLTVNGSRLGIPVFFPEKNLSTDNGAMIAAAAFFHPYQINPLKLSAVPGLYFDQT